MMTGCVFGRDASDVAQKVSYRTQNKRDAKQLHQNGVIVGTAAEIQDQLSELEDAGVERVMLQWLDLDDIDGLQSLAEIILQ
jgi:alkanesulfonate monooxygenase SsuD/methylene tetrahydromethanopterin reductase-like flavin-dependent oxidoreductase (luciferase family)